MLLNRLIEAPAANSREMRAYMAALLEVTGMMSRQGFALRKVMNNLATHLGPKESFPHATLRQADNGLIYVTEEGHTFFSSRLNGSPIVKGQHVARSEVIEMIKKVVAASPPEGWERISAELEEELS